MKERAITNILCLNTVKQKYRVTYDSTKGDSFAVQKDKYLLHFVAVKMDYNITMQETGKFHY